MFYSMARQMYCSYVRRFKVIDRIAGVHECAYWLSLYFILWNNSYKLRITDIHNYIRIHDDVGSDENLMSVCYTAWTTGHIARKM